jgi:predicted nucleic acid-binding protein
MPSERRSIYRDADVCLSYISAIPDRLPILDALLADSASPNGSIEIFTSYITQAEVVYAQQERTNRALDPHIESQIDQLWGAGSAIKLIETHDSILRETRQLMRAAMVKGWRLRPMDAIHLATAKWRKVSEFHTYDKELLRYANDVGFPILAPYTQQPRLTIF